MLPSPVVPGLRVVRVLARTERGEDLLVHLEGDRRMAVLRRAADARAAAELVGEASTRELLDGEGVAHLIDAVTDEHGPSLLLAFHPGRTLASILAERTAWGAGEAAFLLLRLARLAQCAHARGIAFGGIAASDVVVDDEGVYLDVARAVRFTAAAPEAVLSTTAAVGADREALRGVAMEVLTRVSGSRSRAARSLAAELATCQPGDVGHLLERRITELASPVPVGTDDPAVRPERAADDESGSSPAVLGVQPPGASDAVRRLLDPVTRRLAPLIASLASASPGRRRLIVAGAASVVASAVLLAVVPPPQGPDAAVPEVAAERVATPSAEVDDPRASDDPAVAVAALLALRAECFRELSVLCLEGVDQVDSSALHDDRARVASGDAPPVVDVEQIRVVERLGGSALVEIGPETAPASILVVRSEAGWRIRDWIAGGA